MVDFLTQAIISFVGSLAVSITFNVKKENILLTTFGGMLAWLSFVSLKVIISDEIIRYFISSATISIYSNMMARLKKVPVIIFLVVAFFPLVPGYYIYKTMEYLLLMNNAEFINIAIHTFKIVMAIATGFFVTTKLLHMNFLCKFHKVKIGRNKKKN